MHLSTAREQSGTKTLAWILSGLLLTATIIVIYGTGRFRPACITISSLLVVILLIILITGVFASFNYTKGIFNYLIGDEGSYSLSRLQAILWAILIMSQQIAVIYAVSINKHAGFAFFEPVLSESSVWLLGLSLTSAILVKGITVNNLAHDPARYKSKTPHWRDIISGANGLDFSKTQMLIWTIIAMGVYLSKCYYFTQAVLYTDLPGLKNLYTHVYEEYAKADAALKVPPDKNAFVYVPYLGWTYIVLMGLSQGAYVGKKLVPMFKMDEVRAAREEQLKAAISELETKQSFFDSIVGNANFSTGAAGDKNIDGLNEQISNLSEKISGLYRDIEDINNLKQ